MLDVFIYKNYEHLTTERKWSNVPCVGDQILINGRFLRVMERVFRAGQDSIELYVEEDEKDQIRQPDLISKDDPDYLLRRDLLLSKSYLPDNQINAPQPE